MSQGANVSSIEALEAFRANLIVYISKARPMLEEISAEVLRTRQWLESDRRAYWESQVRRRAKELEAARSELFTAGISVFRQKTAAEVMAVRRAEHAMEEAVNKLHTVKKWIREFDSRVEPLARQLEKVSSIVANDLPKGVAYLAQASKTLDAYAAVAPAPAAEPAAPPVESKPVEPGATVAPEEPKP